MKSGVLCLYKEAGMTSHDAVMKVRRLFGTKKVGHTGTLDPQATGVLPILIGNAVKACDLLPDETKAYRASVRFGVSTDTEDIWGKALRRDERRPDRETWERVMASLLGPSLQTPPMMSAVKVGGKKLYEYAREGKVISRPARPIFIYDLTLLSFSRDEATLMARVSKGTYIRTLLTSLCEKADCLGAMSALEREKSGSFTLSQAVCVREIEAMTMKEREGLLLRTEDLFAAYPVFCLPAFFDCLVANGCRVKTKKLGLEGPVGQRLRLYRDGVFFALGEIREEEGETVLCKIRSFPPDEA